VVPPACYSPTGRAWKAAPTARIGGEALPIPSVLCGRMSEGCQKDCIGTDFDLTFRVSFVGIFQRRWIIRLLTVMRMSEPDYKGIDMKSVEECVAAAMDSSDSEIFSFLPYILQDVWEIGASPEVIIGLVRKHARNYSGLRILDLGCGKGAVSIKLAKELHCACLGIDAIEEFISEAIRKAKKYGVDQLCTFEVDDIRDRVPLLPPFDIIILGAIGPVFGDYYATLTFLSRCLIPGGLIIIDDGYIENESDDAHPLMQKREKILQQIRDSGMRLIDEVISKEDEIKRSDDHVLKALKNRCHELMEKHPDQCGLFEIT
jgi:SAM-dependent methyltransferase